MWELDYKESWVLKKLCSWTVVLEKTLESPLDCKVIQPVNLKGNQSWIFIESTDAEAEPPITKPPDVMYWQAGKDLDAGKDWRQEEMGPKGDEIVGWMAWPMQWAWVWVGLKGGDGQSVGPQRVGHDLVTEQQQQKQMKCKNIKNGKNNFEIE